MSLRHNTNFLIPISWQPNFVNLWYFKLKLIHSLKYLRPTILGSKDISLNKLEFVAKTPLISWILNLSSHISLCCCFSLWIIVVLNHRLLRGPGCKNLLQMFRFFSALKKHQDRGGIKKTSIFNFSKQVYELLFKQKLIWEHV